MKTQDYSFGTQFKYYRKLVPYTQRELATKLGVSHTYISKIENDRLEFLPSDDFIRRSEIAMIVDIGALFDASNKIDKEKLQHLAHQSPTICSVLRKLASGKVRLHQWTAILGILSDDADE